VPDQKHSNRLMRYSVQFSLPVGSKVLAARKGLVVRVRNNKDIDVLHDDSTIATYRHLGKVEKGVSAGKHVSAGNLLGVAGKSEIPGKTAFQFTVWRPERIANATLVKRGSVSSLQAASFPVEFCSDSHDCRVLTYSQPVSANSPIKKK